MVSVRNVEKTGVVTILTLMRFEIRYDVMFNTFLNYVPCYCRVSAACDCVAFDLSPFLRHYYGESDFK